MISEETRLKMRQAKLGKPKPAITVQRIKQTRQLRQQIKNQPYFKKKYAELKAEVDQALKELLREIND